MLDKIKEKLQKSEFRYRLGLYDKARELFEKGVDELKRSESHFKSLCERIEAMYDNNSVESNFDMLTNIYESYTPKDKVFRRQYAKSFLAVERAYNSFMELKKDTLRNYYMTYFTHWFLN